MSKKMFILYDGRARYGIDTDDCAVMCTANSASEAWRDSKDCFRDVSAMWFEYDLINGVADNEKPRPDIGKGVLLDE